LRHAQFSGFGKTTSRVRTTSAREAVGLVEWYRAHWEVEILFNTLRKACRVQALQLDTIERLERALADELRHSTSSSRGHEPRSSETSSASGNESTAPIPGCFATSKNFHTPSARYRTNYVRIDGRPAKLYTINIGRH